MTGTKSWQFLGQPGSLPYRVYERARRGLNRSLVAYLRARASPNGRARVLEAGSGPASGSSLFGQHPGVLSVALDIDREALKEGRRRDPTLQAVIGDLHALPFKTGSVDLVWNSSTLEHLEPPDSALAEMGRVVAPKGHVFVGVPYRWGPLGFQPLIKRTALGVWLGPVFSRGELIARMRQASLEPLATRLYFLGFFVGVLARKR